MPRGDLFQVLGDSTRRNILRLLEEKQRRLSVGELTEALEAKEPAVSQHLRILRGAGLIRGERQGRRVLYSIAPGAGRAMAAGTEVLTGSPRRSRLKLSARNRLLGRVTAIERDKVTSSVTLDVGGQTVQSVITTAALDDLGLEIGDPAYAVVKATEVMLMR